MKYLTAEQVAQINARILGSRSVINRSLLESAISRSRHSAFGQDVYPDIFSKAAALFHSLVQNHPFLDGNKRTAFVATVMFLSLNAYWLEVEQDEAVRFVLQVANRRVNLKQIGDWLKHHSKKTR